MVNSNNTYECFRTLVKELYLSNTQRTAVNLPQSFEGLSHTLEVIDLSKNQLTSIPDCLYSCTALKRVDLSSNQITEVHLQIDKWQKMEILNVSSNKLTSLPVNAKLFSGCTFSRATLYIGARINKYGCISTHKCGCTDT